jgi:hypothetical protein
MVVERPDLTVHSTADSTGKRNMAIYSDVFQMGTLGWSKIGTNSTHALAGRLSWRQINNYYDRKNAP